MAKVVKEWEHTEIRMYERIPEEDRQRVKDMVERMIKMQAPPEAIGHFYWHVIVYSGTQKVIAKIIVRGFAIRTIYDSTMNPPQGSVRYRIDKESNIFVKASS